MVLMSVGDSSTARDCRIEATRLLLPQHPRKPYTVATTYYLLPSTFRVCFLPLSCILSRESRSIDCVKYSKTFVRFYQAELLLRTGAHRAGLFSASRLVSPRSPDILASEGFHRGHHHILIYIRITFHLPIVNFGHFYPERR